MKICLLVSTMFETNYSLLDRINVQSDAVIVNQCDEDSITSFMYHGCQIVWVNSSDRGLSKSRNLGMKYIKNDVVLLVDNDEVLENEYASKILLEFDKNKNADLLTFNVDSFNPDVHRYYNRKYKKLNFLNIFRYGSVRIAFLNSFYSSHNISFNEDFGAGTPNGGGEDSLLLKSFLENKAICVGCPVLVAKIYDNGSTWFQGYNEAYFINLGKFMYALFPKLYHIVILLVAIKRYNAVKNIGFINSVACMYRGARKYKASKIYK